MKQNVNIINLVKLTGSQTEFKLCNEKLTNSQDKLEHMSSIVDKVQDDLNKKEKEVIEITRNNKNEIGKIMDELKRIRDKWMPPERYQEQAKYIEELEKTSKMLKDDVNRKKELINNLKSQLSEFKEKESNTQNAKTINDKEALDNSEKIRTLTKDIQRKDNMIKEMKTNLDSLKESDKKNQDEISQLQEKLKIAKIDIQRKLEIIKELKDRMKDTSSATDISANNKVDELTSNIKKLKNDIDRKDGMIKTLKAKLEATNIELDQTKEYNTKISKNTFNEVEKEQKHHDNTKRKLDNLELANENLLVIIKSI
jgi:chromosome segregation ATPase